ncbi:MAG TPA: ABC-F family ATP-binding cassette domain-containing protein [Candidatus Paceibacterota bacterium]|nr:ABC-F family ATP-binding cassette domain-containing protein [Candidatus Pacearchaeota archaeon]HRZ51029.1 ABC-F family ATP-binding cassette domain-containing protein [Candidatus Paceibacterota bacterium]HSA36812.1 ABC-F family ATP-binding cassette domain-containing protein [Candidatus Paceibacterota bacterium]
MEAKIKINKKYFEANRSRSQHPLVILKDVVKTFEKEEIFSDLRLTVRNNDRIAIVGPNGTGKSTVLKMVVGQETADDGAVEVSKEARIGYLPQETHWDSLSNTVLDEVRSANREMSELIEVKAGYEEKESQDKLNEAETEEYVRFLDKFKLAGGFRYEGKIEKILESFGFRKDAWTRRVESLSGGERTKLALAKVLLFNPNMIVLDEPTNHLDIETIEWFEQFLSHWRGAILCVAHDRYFLDKICDKTYELSKEGFEKYYCPYSQYVEERKAKVEKKERDYKLQQKYLKEQEVFINKFRAKATKAASVQSRIKMLDKVERLEPPKKDVSDIKVNLDAGRKVCYKVMELNRLSVGAQGRPLFHLDGKIEVDWGDKVGIIGNNGTGKSTLLKTILSRQDLIKGTIKIHEKIVVGYYAQAHEELDPKKTILDEVASKINEDEQKIRQVLGSLLFTGKDVEKTIGSLSGGERARVALAELILQRSNLLLLDEPTNHLDLPSKEVVTNVLRDFNGTVLLVSHDRYTLNNVCNNIWEVKNSMLTAYPGNYDDFRYHQSLQ